MKRLPNLSVTVQSIKDEGAIMALKESGKPHIVDELREEMAIHANRIETWRAFSSTHGGGRTESMITRCLEDAGLYMLKLEAEYCGSTLEDGLRGV